MNQRQLAEQLGAALAQRKLVLTTAESCTGGWVAKAVTDIPGSSGWFDRGFVTYTNEAKQEMLGVKAATLEEFGAVSEQTAREMACGALAWSHAQISLAISGIAGPGGATVHKPVGTVWLAWCGTFFEVRSQVEHFRGDRDDVRQQAVISALVGTLDVLTATRNQ